MARLNLYVSFNKIFYNTSRLKFTGTFANVPQTGKLHAIVDLSMQAHVDQPTTSNETVTLSLDFNDDTEALLIQQT